ncbi:hypothetical protein AOC36_09935 [Erysipelothrix larvae]|uniref:Uncharacterized protein n=1 Tax=Erysipelothrix larvae TaxID=1514105 RepID=A0A0X8H1G7_9FIRM|nr:V-type ATP synthase subunit I [Erysipelothrix larvae]AMC94280.1 hypothetical protein AOC36_09935 [Erysipelothrix larvae]
MAIVKMSEFKLFVMNDDLETVLQALQRYKNVNFAQSVSQEHPGFHPVKSTYDFENNEIKRSMIQLVIKRVQDANRKKKESKGLFGSLNVKNMSFEEIESVVHNTDLDEILETYSEMYERKTGLINGFQCYVPWEHKGLPIDVMKLLVHQKPMIGTVACDDAKQFDAELHRVDSVFYMTKEVPDKNQVIFVILPPKGSEETLSITAEKYDLSYRSAVSLEITKQVDEMISLLNRTLEKRLNMRNRIQSIGPFEDVLKIHYEYLNNEALKESVKSQFIQSKHVTIMRGWIETEFEDEFRTVVSDSVLGKVDLEITPAPLHSMEVPIKLKNNGFNKAFEPITNMYSQPRYDELDPTPIFAPFYAFFFGMMLADLGYGLVMAIGLGLALKFINFKPQTKDMLKLLFYVSFPTMLWGLIYGSFFGGLVPMKALIDINYDFTMVLILALGFGVFHLFAGMAVKAYLHIRDYKFRYVIYDVLFWYMTLLGAIVLVSMMFTDFLAPYQTIAMWTMIIGMVGIVLTNGRSAKTIPGKAVSGLYSLYGLTNYVGDIVSYSRLMALGLAGASIGMAFNTMMGMVQGFGFMGTLAGIVIFMIGHTFNLLISGLSSYVHSARLTYVEFFGKFFVGGGQAFKAFRSSAEYINVE